VSSLKLLKLPKQKDTISSIFNVHFILVNGYGYRTFEQQRAFNAMRKAWEGLAEDAGIARLDKRGEGVSLIG
jgi:hypothetical protein